MKAGDKRDIRFIDCWNMAKNGQTLPWENEAKAFEIENDECCKVSSSLQDDGTVKVTIETDAYNRKASSKPWIAIVSGDNYNWGQFSETWNSGEAGELTIIARPGDNVKEGQKNFRKNRSWTQDYTVQANGSLKQN